MERGADDLTREREESKVANRDAGEVLTTAEMNAQYVAISVGDLG